MSADPASASAASLSPRQLRQVAALTIGALTLYVAMRLLPTGTDLRHADFVASGPGAALEFCDPANPQFLPVVEVRSPVDTRLASAAPPVVGRPSPFTMTLRTATGKPIGPADLLESHTRRLHVMAIDPTLSDYRHVHPEPGTSPGEWVFTLTPRRPGVYRIFCDFTPAATGRGLYASAEFTVAPAAPDFTPAGPAEESGAWNSRSERDGYVFALEPEADAIRAGRSTGLALTIRRLDGGGVALGEVMGAFAHLVAFDRERSGFAHLHPKEANTGAPPGGDAPRLTFEVTIPERGPYIIWAQLNLDGREVYVPFRFEVV